MCDECEDDIYLLYHRLFSHLLEREKQNINKDPRSARYKDIQDVFLDSIEEEKYRGEYDVRDYIDFNYGDEDTII